MADNTLTSAERALVRALVSAVLRELKHDCDSEPQKDAA